MSIPEQVLKEAKEIVSRLRYAASPDQNGHRTNFAFLATEAANTVERLLFAILPLMGVQRSEDVARALFNEAHRDTVTISPANWETAAFEGHRRYYMRLANAVLALPHTGPNAFVAYDAALERAAQTAIRYGASLHVTEAIRDLKELSHMEQPDDHTQVSREPNPAPQAGCAQEGWRDSDPHPKWKPGQSDRHPQSVEDWDYRNDPVGGAFEVSLRRLCVAGDYADPRVPMEMAAVLRIDLIRLIHDWYHKNAAWESWRTTRAAPGDPLASPPPPVAESG